MSQNLLERGKYFLRDHAAGLCVLGTGLVSLLAFYFLRDSRVCMDWWVDHVSMPFKEAVSALADPLPFSFCELAATVAILYVLVRLVRCIVRAVQRKSSGFGTFALHLTSAVVWIYALVCAFWGTQYYAETFAEKAGMVCGPVAVEQLEAVTRYFAQRTNEYAGLVPRSDSGVFDVPVKDILNASDGIYTGVEQVYPFLEGPQRNPKPAFYSKLMSAAGFTGYLCPLFGESTLNVDCPAVFFAGDGNP